MLGLPHGLEAEALVVGRLSRGGAEGDGRVAVLPRAGEKCLEQLLACALAAPARDDRDRQLRRLLVDEPEARLVLREEAIPRSAVFVRPFECEHPRVALAPPVLHVAVDRTLGVLREPPV